MRKTILAVLMAVMVTTPCLAQEVEPIKGIEGTVWSYRNNSFYDPTTYLGFYEGYVYSSYVIEECFGNTSEFLPSIYLDLPGIGFFWYKLSCRTDKPLICKWSAGILFPIIGVGIQTFIPGYPWYDDNTLQLVPDMSLPENFCPQ